MGLKPHLNQVSIYNEHYAVYGTDVTKEGTFMSPLEG